MKKNPCKFKGTCKNYVKGQPCPYSHDQCKNGPACKFQQRCAFYHPELDNANKKDSSLGRPMGEKRIPMSQTPCKYGSRCIKRFNNQCRFNHQMEATEIKKISKSCRFGQQCKNKNTTCPYEHSSSVNASNIDNQNQPRKKIEQQGVSNSIFAPRNSKPDTDFCTQFMFNRCRQTDDSCHKKHSFIKNDTIKRLFYSGDSSFIRVMNDLKLLFIDRATYYVFIEQDLFHFMKFNETGRTLQKAVDYTFKTGNRISGLSIQDSIMYFCSNNNIITFKPKEGNIEMFPVSGDVISIVLVQQDCLLILCQNDLPKIFVKKTLSSEKTNLVCQNLIKMNIKKLSSIRKLTCMSQVFFIGLGEQQIIFWNKKLQSKVILLGGKPIDIDSVVSGNHPFCLITVLNQQKATTEIKALDLIALQVTTVCQAKITSNQYFTKLICIDKNCYVQLSTGCILIYQIPSFEQIVGMIGFSSQIVSMQKDRDKKLIILQKDPRSGQGSFSIYKTN